MKTCLGIDGPTYFRLERIERAVNVARTRYFKKNPGFLKERFTAPSRPHILYKVIHQLDLPKEHTFADLGSGFGAACFTAALYFGRVVGLEKISGIVAVADEVKQELGISNVEFVNQDFREAALAEFKVLYFYQPDIENFVPEMSQILEGVNCGTVVISNIFEEMRPSIFPRSSYELLQHMAINIFVHRKRSG